MCVVYVYNTVEDINGQLMADSTTSCASTSMTKYITFLQNSANKKVHSLCSFILLLQKQ